MRNRSVEFNTNLVRNCEEAVDDLSTTWEQAVRTVDTVQPVNKLLKECYMHVNQSTNLFYNYLFTLLIYFDPDLIRDWSYKK